MKYIVRLKPSGVSFEANADKPILESALNENIHLEHSCKSGDCDTCSAVLASGRVRLENGEVFESGEFKTCNTQPLSDIDIEVNYYPELAEIVRKTVPLKVNAVNKLNDDVLQLFLRLPPTAKFEYIPGQYIDLTYQGVTRSYSIANANSQGSELELHVKRVVNGEMSSFLFGDLQTNTLMRAFGPNGTFFVRPEDVPIAFLVTGTGFAPAKAMIEELLIKQGSNREIYLLWGARTQKDLYSDQPVEWEREYNNFRFTPVLSRPSEDWGGEIGYVQSAFVKTAKNISEYQVYACGSLEMIESARLLLTEKGLEKTNFFSDAFVATTN